MLGDKLLYFFVHIVDFIVKFIVILLHLVRFRHRLTICEKSVAFALATGRDRWAERCVGVFHFGGNHYFIGATILHQLCYLLLIII